MKFKTLHSASFERSPLTLPPLGYGAASLGNLYREVSDETAFAALNAGWDAGMRYFDSAPFYGYGLSERRLGDFLRSKHPDEYVISTKVGRLLKPVPGHFGAYERSGFCSPMPFEPVYDYSYDGVMRAYEDSLHRLGLSKIDILFVHDIGEATHGADNAAHFKTFIDSGYKALDELRASGTVKAIGLGVNEWQVCDQAMDQGQFDVFLLAGRYSLLEQEPLSHFLPKCLDHGARLVIGGVYNSGILATGVRSDKPAFYNYAPAPQDIIDRVALLEEVCAAHNVSLAAAALQFPIAHAAVASVLVGLGHEDRVRQTFRLFNEPVPAALWSDLKAAGLIEQDAPTP